MSGHALHFEFYITSSAACLVVKKFLEERVHADIFHFIYLLAQYTTAINLLPWSYMISINVINLLVSYCTITHGN